MTDRDLRDNCRSEARADAARAAIHAHALPDDIEFGDIESMLVDLLADLRYWASQQVWQPAFREGEELPGPFEYAVRLSAIHYPEDPRDCQWMCRHEGIKPTPGCALPT